MYVPTRTYIYWDSYAHEKIYYYVRLKKGKNFMEWSFNDSTEAFNSFKKKWYIDILILELVRMVWRRSSIDIQLYLFMFSSHEISSKLGHGLYIERIWSWIFEY